MDFSDVLYRKRPFDGVFVMDVHGHCGGEKGMQTCSHYGDGLLHTMDHMSVDVMCISSVSAFYSDWEKGNNETAKILTEYPERFVGYAVVNPYYADCDMTPYFEEHTGFRGLKVHANAQGEIPENDPRYFRFYEFANERKLPILFHAWCPWEIDRAADVARRYPDAKVILGHGGVTFGRDNAVAACKKYDNVFCDTTISSACDGVVEELVDQVGEDRVLYGSDMPSFECIHNLGKIAMSRLTDQAKEKILGLNAKKLFEL